jgi:hypothetical protein
MTSPPRVYLDNAATSFPKPEGSIAAVMCSIPAGVQYRRRCRDDGIPSALRYFVTVRRARV